MRIRLPFAGVFVVQSLLAAYVGLSSLNLDHVVNDKVLHVTAFFLLTFVFYWVIDTSRRRTLNLTLAVCTLGLGVGSEFLQHALPNGRNFDIYDIIANLVGSLAAVALCSWYHLRMLDRKRQRRYNPVPGEEPDDVELGQTGGDVVDQDEGILASPTAAVHHQRSLEDEVDNWDENAVDNWDEDDEPEGDIGASGKTPALENGAEGSNKKRAD